MEVRSLGPWAMRMRLALPPPRCDPREAPHCAREAPHCTLLTPALPLTPQVTRHNFWEALPAVEAALEGCAFFALDCEMTGLFADENHGNGGRPVGPLFLDEPEDRYQEVRGGAGGRAGGRTGGWVQALSRDGWFRVRRPAQSPAPVLTCATPFPFHQTLASSSQFLINQFGLSCFSWEAGGAGGEGPHWAAKTFNFYLFPRPFEGWDRRFLCQVSPAQRRSCAAAG